MAFITEVGSPPTEPWSNGAAKLALILDELFTMFITIRSTRSENNSTFSTDKVLFIEYAVRIVILSAIPQTTEIRGAAFETLKET